MYTEMNLNCRNLYIFVWSFLPFGLADISCGSLKVEYVNHEDSIDCKIQLSPSSEMNSYITESKLYRWIQIQNSHPRIILQKNAGTYDKLKYGENNFTLLIRDLNQSDEGRYRVHCWTPQNTNYFSPEVIVVIPVVITSAAKPEQPSDARIGTTALIVISLCAVVIVAIIAGTVVLILRRRKNGQEGSTQLVNDKKSLRNTRILKNEESVYNEIDIDKMAVDYARVDKGAVTSNKKTLNHSVESPVLPSRRNRFQEDKSDNEYALVNDTDALVKDSYDPNSDYAEVVVLTSPPNVKPTSSREEAKSTTDFTTGNGKAVAETYKEHKVVSESKTEVENISKVNNVKNVSFPEYAKVKKRKPENNLSENRTPNFAGGKEYKITFPKIDCSEITQSLGKGFKTQKVPVDGERVIYSNLVSRPQRIKSRRSRASRRSLQYAVLELAEPDVDHSDHTTNVSEELFQKMQPCQYASIDFDKKAFVAPVRKAPSSWYKRRNKKGKGK